MRIVNGEIRLAATDVSNHLACRHLTELEISAARGERDVPKWESPDMVVIRELGLRHETKYLALLEKEVGPGNLLNLSGMDEKRILDETRKAMESGVEAIAQGALLHGRFFGRPDVLRKVHGKSSRFGNWTYEAYDCKLSKETKATTILQLSFYSELLGEIQRPPNETPAKPAPDPKSKSKTNKSQAAFDFDAAPISAADYLPENMWVVPPGKEASPEKYRVAEYSAYYRHIKERLETSTNNGHEISTYPEPCLHCDICRWFRQCDRRRRDDKHLSLVAGIRRQQRDQLEIWQVDDIEKLAAMLHPLPREKKPLHGSRESYDRVREQARIQVESKDLEIPKHEPILPVVEKTGFCKLPEPSPGDVFVDLEGDPFVGNSGLQYLFGVAVKNADDQLRYEKVWAYNPGEEKTAFEWFVDLVTIRRKEFPTMHVYHFGGYEPGAFKNLMGLYATREEEIDSMLRAGLFIDLHSIFKQALRAGVEEYSLKTLEHFAGFKRSIHKDDSRAAMRYITHSLELGWSDAIPENFITDMETYNRDDCFATSALRDWLESQRSAQIAAGHKIDRPPLGDGAPTEDLNARQQRVKALVERLTAGIPPDASKRDEKQSATWLLAQLLDFHRRESKAGYWEGFRLAALDEEDLLDDRAGLAGLNFVKRLAGGGKQVPTDRYSFAKQETDARIEKELWCGNDREKCVTILDIDFAARTVEVKKTRKSAECHPTAVYVWKKPYGHDDHADSLLRLGDQVLEHGIEGLGSRQAVRDLLLRKPPRLLRGETLKPLPLEEAKVTASRVAGALDRSVFAIQGPPGVGKTTTGAHMICDLVRQGKKIGVTAQSHQVIQNLLAKVVDNAKLNDFKEVRCLQKLADREDLDPIDGIAVTTKNNEVLDALLLGNANVVGAVSWTWVLPDFLESVDYLFIDEAGQVALADVVAVGQAAHNIVLIGDPQQLERPVQGSHPPGADKSAVEHVMGDHKTIPPEKGMLLPVTYRLHPNICEFTSTLFYEARLQSFHTLDQRIIAGHPWLNGAGLWFVPTDHTGCRNSSPQEVEIIRKIITSLAASGVDWYRTTTTKKRVMIEDVLVVAPYNAQVSDLLTALPNGARVGTVDKFQGQEAPVVIFSLTTSTPEDAPRGMEFLYSLNRFNVATSRAQTAVIVVGNPRLFEPECKSPRQMQLANAFCAYLERAQTKEIA